MTAEQHLKEEIKTRIEYIPVERLSDVLEFIRNIEVNPEVNEILSYAGILEEVDQDIFDEWTIRLHESRILQSRQLY